MVYGRSLMISEDLTVKSTYDEQSVTAGINAIDTRHRRQLVDREIAWFPRHANR